MSVSASLHLSLGEVECEAIRGEGLSPLQTGTPSPGSQPDELARAAPIPTPLLGEVKEPAALADLTPAQIYSAAAPPAAISSLTRL